MLTFDYSGQVIDERYKILRLLGRGGMGSVYLGQHVVIGKQVAVKFLRADLAQDEGVVKRFYREAQAAAAIGHPNIIEVMDVGVSIRGDPYLVMEYLEGESLADLLARTGPLDIAAACGILEPVLLALSATHDKGIVHRDLKPENIFIAHLPDTPPRVKLIDFGISKFKSDSAKTRLTKTGYVLGTPSYISPEQVRGLPDVDQRADLYAVGVVLYEMLSGRLPFEAEHYNKLLIDVLTADPIPPKEAFDRFPDAAVPLITRALRKNPDDRYQSAAEMLEALRALTEFEDRQERLSHYASGIAKKSFARGDLGSISEDEGRPGVASDVLSQLVAEATPDGWPRTTVSVRGRLRVALGALILIGIGLGIWAILWNRDRFTAPAATVSPALPSQNEQQTAARGAEQVPDGVLITVKGAPRGAAIYYREAPVPTNPFRVERRETIAPLRVELSGFEPFVITLVPTEDQVIEVSLKAVGADETDPAGAESPGGAKKRSPPTPASLEDPAGPGKKKLGLSGRGAKYSEEFE